MTLERIAPARPVPVLHIHSLDDPRALYGGGLGPPFPLTDVRVSHRPVVDGLAVGRAGPTVIDAAEEIWRFVRRFTRPDAPPLR